MTTNDTKAVCQKHKQSCLYNGNETETKL